MAKVVHGLMAEWKAHQMIAKNEGKQRVAPEGTLLVELRFPALFFYRAKVPKSIALEKIK